MKQVLIEKLVSDKNVVNLLSMMPEKQREAALLIAIGCYEEPVGIEVNIEKFAKQIEYNVIKVHSTSYNALEEEFKVHFTYERECYYKTEADRDADRYRSYYNKDENPFSKTIIITTDTTVRRDSADRYGIVVGEWVVTDKNAE